MSIVELQGWASFYRRRPFSDEAADIQNALLCSIVANIMRGKGQQAFKVEDFRIIRERQQETAKAANVSEADAFRQMMGR